MKKIYNSGAAFMLIAVVFALSAINKTISTDPGVIFLQWLCVVGFALLGFLRLRKTRNQNVK